MVFKKKKILLIITLFISMGSIAIVVFPAYIIKSNKSNKQPILPNRSLAPQEADILEEIKEANKRIANLEIKDIKAPTVKNKDYKYSEDNFNPPVKEGFSFKYKNTRNKNFALDSFNGVAYVTYEVDVFPKVKDTKTKEMEFQVFGFTSIRNVFIKSLDDLKLSDRSLAPQEADILEEIKEANKRIANLEIKDIKVPTVKNKDYKYSEDNFNPPVKEGFSFKYKNTQNKNFALDSFNGVAYVTYEVDVFPKVKDTKTKEMKFQVFGFTSIRDVFIKLLDDLK